MTTGAVARRVFCLWTAVWSALILMVPSSDASPANCKLVGWYVSRAVFSSDKGKVEYSVRVSDPSWEIESFGWHANAMFGCVSCAEGSIRNGLLWFSEVKGMATPPATEDDQEFMSMVSSSWFAHSDDRDPKPVGDQVVFDWSGFKAYARRYRAHSSNGDDADLFAITITDGCAQARIYASRPHEGRIDDADQLQKLSVAFQLTLKKQ